MEEINITKHTIKTLDFIFKEADKNLSDVLNAINQNSNRSFFLFGLYISLISFSFSKIITFEYQYFILLIGAVISCLIIRKNLFPTIKEIKGSTPSDMINTYFDDFKNEELEKEYLATQIQSYDTSIGLNRDLINKMTNRYVNSFKILILFTSLFFLVFFIMFIKCD